jgi:hypothetical protein
MNGKKKFLEAYEKIGAYKRCCITRCCSMCTSSYGLEHMFLGCGNAYFLPKVEDAPEPSQLLPHNFKNSECARGSKQCVWWSFLLLLTTAMYFCCN